MPLIGRESTLRSVACRPPNGSRVVAAVLPVLTLVFLSGCDKPEAHPQSAPAITATALDTTGAGDLLVAAYIWADLRGASPE